MDLMLTGSTEKVLNDKFKVSILFKQQQVVELWSAVLPEDYSASPISKELWIIPIKDDLRDLQGRRTGFRGS
jgi:hypothetical protein